MEEISVQEAAGSPGAPFQSLETPSESLSPEPQFLQDTDMEQGLAGGKAGRALASRSMGVWRGSWAWYRRGARNSQQEDGPLGGLRGRGSVPQFSPGGGPLYKGQPVFP